jgi:AAA15 family ATPase/GTPase
MINDIEIRNYKCFEHLSIKGCRRINVIVGDNGSGKTALLEAIFLGLGMTSELVPRFRAQRGLDSAFRATPQRIADALFNDLFYGMNLQNAISIVLTGSGIEARSLQIARHTDGAPITFRWTDSKGLEHKIVPQISPTGNFPDTGEEFPDFFLFASNQTQPSTENAERFSDLSRAKRQRAYVDVFSKEYSWIEDLDIEVLAGAPAIYASIYGLADKLSLPNVSGGINRFSTVLGAIASRRQSIVLVDEMENGLYYKHYQNYWKSLITFSRQCNSQFFTTTHSEEWLKALAAVTQLDNLPPSDISLWRLENDRSNHPVIRQFEGEQMMAGIAAGGVR